MQYFGKVNAAKIASKFKNKIYKWSSVPRTWMPKLGKNKPY
jgi:hypothetical protein